MFFYFFPLYWFSLFALTVNPDICFFFSILCSTCLGKVVLIQGLIQGGEALHAFSFCPVRGALFFSLLVP